MKEFVGKPVLCVLIVAPLTSDRALDLVHDSYGWRVLVAAAFSSHSFALIILNYFLKKNSLQGWRDGSVGIVYATQCGGLSSDS